MSTLLLIDAAPHQRARLRETLEAAKLFERVLEAGDGVEAALQLRENEVDLVICDVELPRLGSDALRAVCDPPGAPVPFLVLTGTHDPEVRAQLLRTGACDVLSKPFHPVELVARLELHLRLRSAERELLERNRRLEALSATDALTGLHNRRHLEDVLQLEFLRARRYRTPLSVVIADADHFKTVNDDHGHAVGDDVLRAIAKQLRERVRATDACGRWGGEEFLAVLSNTPADGAAVFAERWRESAERSRVELAGGGAIAVTLSLGIAEYGPGHDAPAELVADADAALYRAKRAGRNRVAR